MSDYLEKAKELLEQPGLEITQKGIDLARTYATVAIAEQLEKMNDMEWMGSRDFVIKWYKEDK